MATLLIQPDDPFTASMTAGRVGLIESGFDVGIETDPAGFTSEVVSGLLAHDPEAAEEVLRELGFSRTPRRPVAEAVTVTCTFTDSRFKQLCDLVAPAFGGTLVSESERNRVNELMWATEGESEADGHTLDTYYPDPDLNEIQLDYMRRPAEALDHVALSSSGGVAVVWGFLRPDAGRKFIEAVTAGCEPASRLHRATAARRPAEPDPNESGERTGLTLSGVQAALVNLRQFKNVSEGDASELALLRDLADLTPNPYRS